MWSRPNEPRTIPGSRSPRCFGLDLPLDVKMVRDAASERVGPRISAVGARGCHPSGGAAFLRIVPPLSASRGRRAWGLGRRRAARRRR